MNEKDILGGMQTADEPLRRRLAVDDALNEGVLVRGLCSR